MFPAQLIQSVLRPREPGQPLAKMTSPGQDWNEQRADRPLAESALLVLLVLNLGQRMGERVGVDVEGTLDGKGVGIADGAEVVGALVGNGVGAPGTNVGEDVGFADDP